MPTTLNRNRYAKLLTQTMPRVIRTDLELAHLTQILLAIAEQPRPTREERELAELLTTLLTNYEQKHRAIPSSPPQELLIFLLSTYNLSAKDLWPIIGSKGITSEILNGKR